MFINAAAGRSVAGSLDQWLAGACGNGGRRVTLVTSFVTYGGLMLLVPRLRRLIETGCQVRLLIGVVPDEQAEMMYLPHTTDARAEKVERRCQHLGRVLRAELNETPINSERFALLQDLARLLAHPLMQVAVYKKGYLHAKAVITEGGGRTRAVIGSSNFTLGGLRSNQELNCEIGAEEARQSAGQADIWWGGSAPLDLAGLIGQRLVAFPPELTFLRFLHEAFGEHVNAQGGPLVALKSHQSDGLAQVRRKCLLYGGALIADEVGLGKTFIAGEIIRNPPGIFTGPALTIGPANLEGMWMRHMALYGIQSEYRSYEKIGNSWRAVRDHGHRWPVYGVVVVDEAHNLRNPLTERMSAVRSLLAAQPSRPLVLLLTGTPVNNGAEDLFELLALADHSLEPHWQRGRTFTQARSLERSPTGRELADLCEQANAGPLGELDRRWLAQQLTDRMLRRDRDLIRFAYPESNLAFPHLEHQAIGYQLTSGMRRLFVEVVEAMGSEDKLPGHLATMLTTLGKDTRPHKPLTLAVYQKDTYRLGGGGPDNPQLLGLLRAMLCKRIESSPAAFAATAANMATTVRQALDDLDHGIVRISEPSARQRFIDTLTGWEPDTPQDAGTRHSLAGESDDLLRGYSDGSSTIYPASEFDTAAMRADLEHDLDRLSALANAARHQIPHDPKKREIRDLLLRLLRQPERFKIVVFASARETTTDLGDYLQHLADTDPKFQRLQGRIANLGTKDRPSPRQTEDLMARFAPDTAGHSPRNGTIAPPSDDFDVLICTDAMAEGVNLQQASHCVHYDLTWNPQRMRQRAGRLDRVGSHHKHITCWTILPDKIIDVVLGIMDILIRKIDIAARTVGVFARILPNTKANATYTELLYRLRHPEEEPEPPELLDRDNNWWHAWLGDAHRNPAIKDAILNYPHWAGAVHPRTAKEPSVVYCFRVTSATTPPHHQAAFAQAFAGPRDGAVVTDDDACLRAALVDPTTWMKDLTQAIDPTDYPPLDDRHLYLMATNLDRARDAVAEAHSIPAITADSRIHLIAWIVIPGPELTKTPAASSARRHRHAR
ncbi:helicase-related protein [Longispora albida]|uniref:helicase-related protein n=1 Tax=Longispora albida TaxID=203523 RepID=UPI000367B8F0|nr:helicase-related protein [Longispora albida]